MCINSSSIETVSECPHKQGGHNWEIFVKRGSTVYIITIYTHTYVGVEVINTQIRVAFTGITKEWQATLRTVFALASFVHTDTLAPVFTWTSDVTIWLHS